ncbi:stage II sporulation protein M [Actinomycetaceae bacterium TAE3-ERU4]|nr:stage II sporulation protein M [Actinomycetaceae bacterium TAE3-ERU4]
MDTDALVAARQVRWKRFEELLDKRTLSGSEIDELVALYRQSSADLVRVKTTVNGEYLSRYLSDLNMRARSRMAVRRQIRWSSLGRVIKVELPALLYQARYWIIGTYIFSFIVAAMQWNYLAQNPHLMTKIGTEAQLREYANKHFIEYYTENPNSLFAATVWTNNALIAVITVAAGITGFGAIYVLFTNSLMIGQAGAIVSRYSSTEEFFNHILPHGQLELSAIYLSCGAAFYLLWRLLVPGRKTRMQVIAEEGKRYLYVLFFLVFLLGVSGLQEGFVTPSNLPVWLKILQGSISLFLLWFYILYFGKKAQGKNETDFSADSAYLPVA